MMFRKMRRVEKEIPLEEAKALLRSNRRGALSVHGEDGYPYTVPINFYYDEAEHRLYFHSAKKGHKIDALRKDDKVCFTTWEDGYLEEGDWAYHVSSCVVFGRARLLDDAAVTEEKVRNLAMKYYPSAQEVEAELAKDIRGVQLIAIEIEHISGKHIQEK